MRRCWPPLDALDLKARSWVDELPSRSETSDRSHRRPSQGRPRPAVFIPPLDPEAFTWMAAKSLIGRGLSIARVEALTDQLAGYSVNYPISLHRSRVAPPGVPRSTSESGGASELKRLADIRDGHPSPAVQN